MYSFVNVGVGEGGGEIHAVALRGTREFNEATAPANKRISSIAKIGRRDLP
jgi:hypothetical protein